MTHPLPASKPHTASPGEARNITDDMSDAALREALPRLRRFALWLTRDPAAADDLVQSTMERALTRWRSRRPDGDFLAWLFSILYRQFLDSKRRAKRYARLLEWFTRPDPAPSAERSALARSSLEAFDRLPEAQRTLLWLICVDGISYKAAADLFGVPLGTIMSRLSRARQALREASDGPSTAARLRILK